jgi:hypothetical protein
MGGYCKVILGREPADCRTPNAFRKESVNVQHRLDPDASLAGPAKALANPFIRRVRSCAHGSFLLCHFGRIARQIGARARSRSPGEFPKIREPAPAARMPRGAGIHRPTGRSQNHPARRPPIAGILGANHDLVEPRAVDVAIGHALDRRQLRSEMDDVAALEMRVGACNTPISGRAPAPHRPVRAAQPACRTCPTKIVVNGDTESTASAT